METISRRKFIQLSSLAGTYLVVGFGTDASGSKLVARITSDISKIELNQFISIGTDGSIILLNHRPEMGQGTFQSIPMILAEELEVRMDQISIRQSEANAKLFGNQMVVGSRSIQTEFEKLRKMGAAAREMLKQAAANRWKINIAECTATNGTVVNKSGTVLTYGDLVAEAGKLSPPENPPLKSPKDFKVLGKSSARMDIPLKTNGEAIFGIDVMVPGMLYASVERSPLFLGKVKSFNKDEVLKVPGVKHVLQTERQVYGQTREGVAVLADNYWNALQGRKVLKVDWDNQKLAEVSDATILSDSYEAAKTDGDELFGTGDVKKVFTSSTNIIEVTYETPYQAHVP
ncbi:MAG: xanthine dehydrogenase family protein molybdopterin-binding subunit, partial [Bacteroidia bacterium]|nr:xanthine dehydrogenase family protein molybdopterin-binding subunit [Bacteroidia bacterium]